MFKKLLLLLGQFLMSLEEMELLRLQNCQISSQIKAVIGNKLDMYPKVYHGIKQLIDLLEHKYTELHMTTQMPGV